VGKKFGQFGQNLAINGQSLEKVSQPRGMHFLKLARFLILAFNFFINQILRHGIYRILLTLLIKI
jgi:hypothetical protein